VSAHGLNGTASLDRRPTGLRAEEFRGFVEPGKFRVIASIPGSGEIDRVVAVKQGEEARVRFEVRG